MPTFEPAAVAPVAPPGVSEPAAVGRASDGGFASSLTNALQGVEALQHNADQLAIQAATGQLDDPHRYTVAATQAQLATDMAVTFRNRAVEAFNEIMRMPV